MGFFSLIARLLFYWATKVELFNSIPTAEFLLNKLE